VAAGTVCLPRLPAAAPSRREHVTVALFLRGGADGLNIVAPHGDPDYYRLRPSIAVPRPGRGRAGAAIDLDGFFGLHPSLAPLEPLWRAGHLAIAHAAGLPGAPRRHFEAEAALRSALGAPHSATPDLGAIARRIRAGAAARFEVAEIGGWDLHVNQARQLSAQLDRLGRAIASFWREMGDRMADATLIVLSEFGRSARENGSGGADHGSGNCVLALGGSVRGGRVYGTWPGLSDSGLAVSTNLGDFLRQTAA
jgi:uncharacterized protein (DUF1501 family)